MPIPRRTLQAAFLAVYRRRFGALLERLPGRVVAFRDSQNGKTFKLRTNNERTVLEPLDSLEAPMSFEGCDFLALAFPGSRSGTVAVYCVPSGRAAQDLRDRMRHWLAMEPLRERSGDNTLHAVHFDDRPTHSAGNDGFARIWGEFLLGEIALEDVDHDPVPSVPGLASQAEVFARHRRELAAETGFPESAFRIFLSLC